MKKFLSLVLALLMVFALVACSADTAAAAPAAKTETKTDAKAETKADAPAEEKTEVAYNTEVKPFKVAVFIALSGANANSAVFQIQALDLAVEQINNRGGIEGLDGAKLELVYFDNMSDANAMKTVVENALEDPDINFAMFPLASTYTTPAIPTLSKLKCPALTTSQGDTIFAQGCDYIYGAAQVSSKAAVITAGFVQYLKETYDVDTTKIGVVAVDNDYGRMNMESLSSRYSEWEGYELVYNEAYPADIADMSSIVTALKNADVQLLHSINLDQDGKLFFATLKGMNYNPLIIGGGSGIMYPTFIEACGSDLEGILSGTHTNPNAKGTESDPVFQELKQMCYDQYHHYGGEFLVSYYSQMQIIHQLLNETKSYDREVNNKAMKTMEFHTLFPKIDADGNYTDIQYFDEFGMSPNSTTEIAQFQYDENGELWPTCVYPEALAAAPIQWNN